MGFLNNSIFLVIIIVSVILNQIVLHLPVVAAKDVLNPSPGVELNSSYSSTDSLLSQDGQFTLGFFSTAFTNFTYLGIWYTNEPDGMIVWVANRDSPLIDDYAVLTIDDAGTVKVVDDGNGTTLFNVFINQFGRGNNTRAVLKNEGNFVVYDATDNQTLWQSVDYPTDTLVPGMKLGYNLTTNQSWTLTSGLSDVFLTIGAFTMRLEEYQNSPQLVIYRRGELYWASGPWNSSNRTFQFVDRDSSNNKYAFHLYTDATSMYLISGALPSPSATLQLSPLGNLFDGSNELVTPEFCYGYQSDHGCAKAEAALPSCRSQSDTIQLKKGDWIGDFTYNHDDNSSIGISDCMERCWNNCSCIGFSTNDSGLGCYTYAGDALFQLDGLSKKIQKYVVISQKPPKKSRAKKTWIRIVVPVVFVLTSVSAAFLCYVMIQRHKHEEEEKRKLDFINQLARSDSFNFGDELEKGIKDAPNVKVFSLKAILAATNNFSNENKLGQGGYGPVYKGKLSDGRELAVKRLSKASGQGIDEFKSELVLISKLQHTNLVRLYGCCIHQEEKMLIYEFLPNKSLDFFLFDEDKKQKLDWQTRFNIIEGVAQGLLYLHKYSRMKVIHRDLKVSNILLDENMNPKIADFGMARIFQQNVAEEITKKIAGTFGYMAPEYAMHGTFSIKSDVFSFGVLILEIVSGKKISSFHNLVGYAWELWKREATLELKDEALGESYDVKQLLRSIHVGLLCVQENANDRPTMSEVISMLSNENVDMPIPKQPAFITNPDEVQSSISTEHSLGNYIQVSVNGLTLTTMEAR